MPRKPTVAQLTEALTIAEARIQAALDLHRPVASAYRVTNTPPVICGVCRDPYPCDTATALGARQ